MAIHPPSARRAPADRPGTGGAGQRRWMESNEATELWSEYRRSGDARLRDRLVLTYAPLVKFIVYRKIGELPPSTEVDDLVSAGLEALIKALDRYDPKKGATLEQFVWTRIHGAVIDAAPTGRRARCAAGSATCAACTPSFARSTAAAPPTRSWPTRSA